MRGRNSQTFQARARAGDARVWLEGLAPEASRASWRATVMARRSCALQKAGGLRNTAQGCSKTSSAEKESRLAKAACRRGPCRVSEGPGGRG